MKEIRKNRYIEKFNHLEKYNVLFMNWINESELEILLKNNNHERIYAIYHSFQLITEVITDLCAMIVKDIISIPKDDYSNFLILKDKEIISDSMYNHLKKMNGLRNRIVHDYNGIVDRIAWDALISFIDVISEFKEAVESWLRNP